MIRAATLKKKGDRLEGSEIGLVMIGAATLKKKGETG
jgi:hypothetical protein